MGNASEKLGVFALTLMIGLCWVTNACAQKIVTSENQKRLESINYLFERMEAQGAETKQPLLYGYFFFDKAQTKLEHLKDDLMKQGYKLVRLEKIEDGRFILHVEKVEGHSRESLHKRETELSALASRFSIETYDGFDVGHADPTKPLISNESFSRFMSTKKGTDLFDLGIRLYDLELNDRAVEVFRECIKQKIKPDVSSFKLGVALIDLNKPDEAIASLEQAVKFNPKYVDAYFNLGAIYYDTGKYLKSLENNEIADRLRPNDDVTVYGMAAAQYALKRFPQSLENCKKALNLNPQNEDAKQLLEMLNRK